MTERIWDRFLTDQDRSLAAKRPRKPVGFGQQPALLLVDLYRWVFGDKPEPVLDAIRTWPGSCGLAGWDALPHIQALLQAARESQIPVIHVAGLAGAGVAQWSFRKNDRNGQRLSAEEVDRQRRKFDIVDEVAPGPGEAILRKSSPSAFWGTPLVAHLNQLRIDTVITCGESTSGCVRASVVEGATYRFQMIVVEECVFDRHEAAHAINLFDMDQKYADVVSLAVVQEYLKSWRGKDTDIPHHR